MRSRIAWKGGVAAVAAVLRRSAETLRRDALGVLYPPRCVSCDADVAEFTSGPMLCQDCQAVLAAVDWHGCGRCGAPIAEDALVEDGCAYCRESSFAFQTVVTLGVYQGKLREAVLRMKRAEAEPLSRAMGAVLCQRRGDLLQALRPDIVMPVPMHWVRRLARKLNNPDLVATPVARFLHLPCMPRALRKVRNTKPQKGLTPRERRHNVVGAFRVAARYDIKGARVLLVDDVLTTGATANEAAKVLRAAGAATVAVAVLARALGTTNDSYV